MQVVVSIHNPPPLSKLVKALTDLSEVPYEL